MRFFETIRIEHGQPLHLRYHNDRLNRTIAHHFGPRAPIDLAEYIDPPKDGLYRCKVIYSESVESIQYHPYTPRTITSLRLIESDIEYSFKYLDRSRLDALFTKRDGADDILIVKDGLLTDTSIANIALYDGETWFTPAKPLLPGTTRARLLDQGALVPIHIRPDQIQSYTKLALLNAMIGFFELENCIIL